MNDPLPNLYAVLRALTAPEDGDEHPFLREAARLDRVYLNPLGVAVRTDGVRALWTTRDGFEAIEILTARDLWPLASIEPDAARLHRIKSRRPSVYDVLSIAAQGTAALEAVQMLRSRRGPRARAVTLFESSAWYASDLVPYDALKYRQNSDNDPLCDDATQERGLRIAGLFFCAGYDARKSFEKLIYPCLVHDGRNAGLAVAQSLRWQLERGAA